MTTGLILVAVLSLDGCGPAPQELGMSRIHQNGAEVGRAPMIPVELELPPQYQRYPVLEAKSLAGKRILFQQTPALLSSGGDRMGRCLVALVSETSPVDSRRLFEAPDVTDRFSFDQTGNGILTIRENGATVFAYRFGMQEMDGVASDRFRSTYIHPIFDPFGSVVTGDFPEDHLHHRGLSWMWPSVTVDDQTHDLWHIRGVRQKFERWLQKESGPLCATIGVKNTWETAERTIADEWVWVRSFIMGGLGRAIDISFTWRARERIAIRGEETKGYGGLCLRFAPRQETVITTPNGRILEDSDLRAFSWADQSGRFGGMQLLSGVAIFQHGENLAYPAGWCLRHYGFLGVSWPGREQFILERDLPVTLRFRIWIHRGNASEGGVIEAFAGFANPPQVLFQN